MEKFRVKFLPDNKTAEAAKDATILSAALSCGVYLNSACGGEGVCGKCKVIVKSGKVITQPESAITPQERGKNIYLACLTTVHSDLEIEVPCESKLDFENLSPQELELRLKGLYSKSEEVELVSSGIKEKFSHSPLVTKLYLKLPAPNLEDRISDLERLYRGIRRLRDIPNIHTGLVNLKQLGELLRDSEWRVTVTLGVKDGVTEVINIEPGDSSKKNFGLSFDIGTTTITGQLIDLSCEKILGTRATYNKQAAFGSDVISRIIFSQEERGLEKLHNTVTDTINKMSRELIEGHAVGLNDVTCILCTGNTTMIHLLLGVDPKFIRREPYVPTLNFAPVIRASEAGININPRGLLFCVPGVASYVGGDTTSGVLFSGIHRSKELSILIDIGTNGEITLGNEDFLIAAAASAGPAFEGSGLSCGMRSGRGAIQKVKINPKNFEVSYETIGKTKPRGICGSGYIDILSSLLRAKIIDRNGKFSSLAGRRIRDADSGREFLLVDKSAADSASDIVITEADIENLKRAKAAIYSAVSVLIRHMNLDFNAIKKFFIAGGFGTYLDMESAISIGLLPDLERKKFIFAGNSALAGAARMLLSSQAAKTAEDIARKITYFELSVDAHYMDEYMAALFFPAHGFEFISVGERLLSLWQIMGYVIAMAGKGGTGKTTIGALIAMIIKEKKLGSVLAVDADPNNNLAEALGMELKETAGEILDKVAAHPGRIPAGMPKERFIEYELQAAISEGDGIDLLTMGRPEGPGCYCYVNNVLRNIVAKLIKEYDYVIIDNEAGLEHLSRRTVRRADALVVVSDPTAVGLKAAQRITDLAGELEIETKKNFLILNRCDKDIDREKLPSLKLDYLGFLPVDAQLGFLSLDGYALAGLKPDALVLSALRRIGGRIWQRN